MCARAPSASTRKDYSVRQARLFGTPADPLDTTTTDSYEGNEKFDGGVVATACVVDSAGNVAGGLIDEG